jgi:hypothetical protein
MRHVRRWSKQKHMWICGMWGDHHEPRKLQYFNVCYPNKETINPINKFTCPMSNSYHPLRKCCDPNKNVSNPNRNFSNPNKKWFNPKRKTYYTNRQSCYPEKTFILQSLVEDTMQEKAVEGFTIAAH